MAKKRPRIGLLIDFFYDEYQLKIWSGAVQAAEDFDCSLYCFAGGAIDCPQENSAQRNHTYDLVLPSKMDGIIVISAVISNHIPPNKFKQFYKAFKHLPNVSIGVEIEGCPSILVDNKKGMADLVSHLVEEHNFRRIAFIQGPSDNPEAQARYNGYIEALDKHNIRLRPELVAPGTFFADTGEKAVRLLFDQRKIQCDAIAACNDWTAIGALHSLSKRGIKVPEDIALVGFDNIRQGRFVNPQLTTVYQPFIDLGRHAVIMLLDQFKGAKFPLRKILPTHLRIRNSCGCYRESKHYFYFPASETKSGSIPVLFKRMRNKLINEIKNKVKEYFLDISTPPLSRNWIPQLVDSLYKSLTSATGNVFLDTFKNKVTDIEPENIDIFGWSHILLILFNRFLSLLSEKKDIIKLLNLRTMAVETLWKVEHKIEAEYLLNANRLFREVSWAGQDLITTFDEEKLRQAFNSSFSGLGIECFYVTEFTRRDVSTQYSRFIEAVERGRIRKDLLDMKELETKSIVRRCTRAHTKRECLIIMPLFVQNEKLGFLILEHTKIEGPIYENLAIQASNALKGVMLVDQLSQQTEFLAASNREKELLLKELHHRVKNNLQVINSLLNLQKNQILNKDTVNHFKAIQNRIKSMSMIHEHLYRSKNLTNLNLKHYINELVESLKQSYSIDNKVLSAVESDDIYIPLEKAIPLGLIVNELVSNSLKHAFPQGCKQKAAQIKVICRRFQDKTLFLSVEDNGIGIPQRFDMRKTKSLGMQIIFNIIENQLNGNIELDRKQGLRFKINIPIIE